MVSYNIAYDVVNNLEMTMKMFALAITGSKILGLMQRGIKISKN